MLLMWLCFCFFFKQKTAYEMRISDWSSDVCSSDLIADGQARTDDLLVQAAAAEIRVRGRAGLVAQDYDQMVDVRPKAGSVFPAVGALARSEERRVGKECVSTCRSRWSPSH